LKLNYASLAIGLVLVAVLVGQLWSQPWTVARGVGLALLVPSAVLLTVARIQLGRAFSIRAKGNLLVTTGVYARIRNPIYLFGSLMMAGIVLWLNRPWVLLAFLVLVPFQVVRSRNEAKALAARFGEQYLAYRERSWF
jgi:protein-S-isoprenylcysteine O-methyltransferase Ste14